MFRGTHWSKLPNKEEIVERIRQKNLGCRHTEEWKKHMSEIGKARGFGKWMKGKTLPESTRKKQSLANKGEKAHQWKGGFPTCEECPEKLSMRNGKLCNSCSKRGERNVSWKGGVTSENHRIRHSKEYILWRTAVFVRDDYICRLCGQVGGKLQVDHIKPFAFYPELRFAIDNGRTLCAPCHRKTDTWGMTKKKILTQVEVV